MVVFRLQSLTHRMWTVGKSLSFADYFSLHSPPFCIIKVPVAMGNNNLRAIATYMLKMASYSKLVVANGTS